jgi:plasmid maintenance system antidote protein VapI
MEIGLVNVHVGKAIEARILELGISKLEFANMFGIKGQHVKRILERY